MNGHEVITWKGEILPSKPVLTLEVTPLCGSSMQDVIQSMRHISKTLNVHVRADFNDKIILVGPEVLFEPMIAVRKKGGEG